MKKILPVELRRCLEAHRVWLETHGRGGKRLMFEGVDLLDVDLSGADLQGAIMRGVDLQGARLCDVDLCGADLRDADMLGVDLRGADVEYANLESVVLRDADLRYSVMRGADLRNVCYMQDVELGVTRLGALVLMSTHCARRGSTAS